LWSRQVIGSTYPGWRSGGRLFLLASKFGGVRVDRPDLLKKIVVL
jgi:hypothetical protein